ncbi:MAG: DUF411 domain-containing protein [Woeseiaceae bacterium]
MLRISALLFSLLLSSYAFCGEQDGKDESHDALHVEMHKNPGCGCCDVWADHLRSFGFTVESTEDPGILGFKAKHSIPGPLMSCHTAVIDGYFIEGHVPARDILRLLKEKPEAVTGIAVPAMPLGSPGMEHNHPQDFNTIALLTDGSAYVFETHEAGEDFTEDEED